MDPGTPALPARALLAPTLWQAIVLVAVVVLGFLAIAFRFHAVRELYGGRDGPPPERQTNCPSCGARVSVEAETCDYCEEPV